MKSLLSLLGMFTFLFTAVGQDGSQATLKALSEKMESFGSIYAEFESSLFNKQADLKVDQKGKIYVKGDLFNLDLDEYQVISGAENIWTISKSDGEIYIDATADQEEEDMIKPSEIFTIWKTGFKSTLVKTEAINGKNLEHIKLFPIDPSTKSYHTILLNVIKETLEIKEMTLMGKNGDNYSYSIQKFTGNPKLPAGVFELNTANFPDYDVIDNR